MLGQLLLPINPADPVGVEETRMRASALLAKVSKHIDACNNREDYCVSGRTDRQTDRQTDNQPTDSCRWMFVCRFFFNI